MRRFQVDSLRIVGAFSSRRLRARRAQILFIFQGNFHDRIGWIPSPDTTGELSHSHKKSAFTELGGSTCTLRKLTSRCTGLPALCMLQNLRNHVSLFRPSRHPSRIFCIPTKPRGIFYIQVHPLRLKYSRVVYADEHWSEMRKREQRLRPSHFHGVGFLQDWITCVYSRINAAFAMYAAEV